MPTTKSPTVECLNPNSGGKMNIDKATYDLFLKAITHVLKDQPVTFTQLTADIKKYFAEHKIIFNGSVGWYAVTIKNDMQSRGSIEVFMEKGKKLHRLSK